MVDHEPCIMTFNDRHILQFRRAISLYCEQQLPNEIHVALHRQSVPCAALHKEEVKVSSLRIDLGSGPIKSLAETAIGCFNGGVEEALPMSDLIWLSEAQVRRIEPHFPLSHGVPRVDDRRVISGIIFVIRNGLRWRDAPKDYGPHKTIYNRFIRWSRLGVFNKIFAALAARGGKPDQLMIDATHLKAHRTAASLLKKGLFPDVSAGPRAA